MTSRTSGASSAVMEPENSSLNVEDEIRRRAYELYQQHGEGHGHHVEDWLRAEEEIRALHQLDKRRRYLLRLLPLGEMEVGAGTEEVLSEGRF